MALTLQHVGKRVGRETHIDDVSLTLEPGTLNVLLGLTLAGKTTLMRVMAGLDKPTEGRVLADEQDTVRIPVRKRNVAMVYQQFINYPSLTVYENIASPLRLARLSRAEIDRRVRAEAERLHIDHLLERLPGELSGGQQQRTAMARALVREADLLLLDEPLVNLDYKLREELRLEMRRIFSGRRAVVVYATTDPWEALALGGRTAVLQEGRLVQYGPTLEVHEQPATEHVATVFSDPPMNLVDGEITDADVMVGAGIRCPRPAHLAGLTPGRYRFGLRPQHLAIEPTLTATAQFTGIVEVAEISGSDTLVHMAHDEESWILALDGIHRFELDQALTVYFDPERLYAFDTAGRLLRTAPRPAGLSTGEREVVRDGTH